MLRLVLLTLCLRASANIHLAGVPPHVRDTSPAAPLTPRAAPNSSTARLCLSLEDAHPGKLAYPGQAVYDAAQESYYSANQRSVQPACLFTPTSVDDVSSFMRLLQECSRDGSSPVLFAVRSGGHALFTGAANIDGGVTVDMRQLNSVTLSSDGKTATIGAGAAFTDVYPQLDEHNVTVVGGRVTGIAAGGYVSGGGASLFGRSHGWSCDNVYAYHVVLANGEQRRVSSSVDRDLWLALKGGSNNFAIITAFELDAFAQGELWGGSVTYGLDVSNTSLSASSTLRGLADAYVDYMSPAGYDHNAEAQIILGFVGGAFVAQSSVFNVEPVAYPPSLAPFTDIDTIVEQNLFSGNVSHMVNTFSQTLPAEVALTYALVYSFSATDAAGYLDLFSIFYDGFEPIAATAGLQAQFLIQPQPVTNGTNAMRLAPDQRDVVMASVTAVYSNSSDRALVESTVDGVFQRQKASLSSQGKLLPFIYLNYADVSQDVFGSWGTGAREFLQNVSSKYDPLGVFQKQLVGGFKLF
ncbi:hypothetical protein PRZ48_008234 [Zasmidium cellare]|uniref:FAD-binding PCMH-type domain-containing protein n=1 Tax=Zasmidium cellare TaxID=395010 RepID=A0ABR0EG52_ZASCE|nr:hypothetical protein PRZ48_008234 [Zasmidium cellare]